MSQMTFSSLDRKGLTSQRGLALVEVMVTILLTSLVFALIYSLSQAQAKMQRHQQHKERFLVDTDALIQLLERDLSSAFIVNPTSASHIIEIGHFARDSEPESGSHPFNSEPLGDPPPPPGFRGKPIRTCYKLVGQTLRRESQEIPTTAPEPPISSTSPFTDLAVMDGIDGISTSVDSTQVTRIQINLSLVSDTSVHTLTRFLYAPGLAQ